MRALGRPVAGLFVWAQLAAERAHLVLEELAQRLDQLHAHAFGQAADGLVAVHAAGNDQRGTLPAVELEPRVARPEGEPQRLAG